MQRGHQWGSCEPLDHGAAKEQVADVVDMAKADALGLLGEPHQALELVDRHV